MIPHLRATKSSAQLMVKGKPFLMLPAELHNSSLSSAEYMSTIWPKMQAMNINTLLGSVTWEMIEPVENQFDFSELDEVILGARQHGLHLVLLWFGSYKNAKSTYVPAWVKRDAGRFPRVHILDDRRRRKTLELLSPFSAQSRDADANAFSKLMQHLKEIDEEHSTVLMVQVENEPGLLGDSRDRSTLAERAFREPIPSDLMSYLQKKDKLHPQFQRRWPEFRSEAAKVNQPTWETLFGQGDAADEMFMADIFARYVAQVATAGKKSYDLPLYTNAWLNFEDPALLGDDLGFGPGGHGAAGNTPLVAGGGSKIGDYPCGGPCPHTLDIWQCHTRGVLAFLSPDLYLQDYEWMCRQYRYDNMPLFIPEQKADEQGARRTWLAYGTYGSLGCSPFGIDSIDVRDSPFTETFGLLGSVSQYILEAQAERPDDMFGFFFDEIDSGKPGRESWVRVIGEFQVTVQRSFVFGNPGPGHGIVMHRGDGTFLLIGAGFQVSFKSTNPSATFTGLLRSEEKEVDASGNLRTLRTLNGDETKSGAFMIMPNRDPDYGGFPIRVTIPARTCIAECTAYSIEDKEEHY
jgi:hypothetical protein